MSAPAATDAGRARPTPTGRARHRPAPPAHAGLGGALLDAYLYGNQVVVTLLAFVVRAGLRRDPHRRLRRADPHVARLLLPATRATRSARAGRRSRPATRRCSAARSSTPTRCTPTAACRLRADLRHAGQRGAADPRRPRGRRRVPRRPVQHRRAGPADHRRDLRRLRRLRLAPAAGVHLLVALLAGILGGALWGGIVGLLKARTGAHEVITTIMLNYVALYLLSYLLGVDGLPAAGLERGDQSRHRARHAPGCRTCSSDLPHSGLILALARRRRLLVAAVALDARASGCGRSAPTRSPPAPPA